MTTNAVNRHSHPGEWPSGKATDFEWDACSPGDNGSDSNGNKKVEISPQRVATGIDWAFAPDWLTVEEACFLSGRDRGYLLQVIDVDGIDLNSEGLIEKMSLWEWQETEFELAHWQD